MIEKVNHLCHEDLTVNPGFCLFLMDPERYEEGGDSPDYRIYKFRCLACGMELAQYVTENTLSAIKELRDTLDTYYGKSYILPQV